MARRTTCWGSSPKRSRILRAGLDSRRRRRRHKPCRRASSSPAPTGALASGGTPKALLERDDVEKVYLPLPRLRGRHGALGGELWRPPRAAGGELDASAAAEQAVTYAKSIRAARDDSHVQRSQAYVDAIVQQRRPLRCGGVDVALGELGALRAVNFEGVDECAAAAGCPSTTTRRSSPCRGRPRGRWGFWSLATTEPVGAGYDVAALQKTADSSVIARCRLRPLHDLGHASPRHFEAPAPAGVDAHRVVAEGRRGAATAARGVAPGRRTPARRHNPVVWEQGACGPRPPRLGARVVVDALYGAHASGSPRRRRASDGTRFLRGEYEEHDDSWGAPAHVVDWVVEPPAAIGPGTSATVDSHGRTEGRGRCGGRRPCASVCWPSVGRDQYCVVCIS